MCSKHYQAWWKQNKYKSRLTATGKVCNGCKQDKPLAEFYSERRSKHGYHTRCKECIASYSRAWRARNAANDPDYERQAWYRSAEYRRQIYLTTGWTHFLMKRYKLSADDFHSKLDAQGGGCAICDRRDSGEDGRQMHVDHCHKTGVARGILCAPCNKGSGMFADDPDRLVAAATYLLQYMNALAMPAWPSRAVRSAYVDVPDGATGSLHIHDQPAGSGVQDGFATASAPRGRVSNPDYKTNRETKLVCVGEDCSSTGALKRGMCSKHYQAWWKQNKYKSRLTATGKVCNGCKQDKPLAEFYFERRSKHGYHARCKECVASYSRAWRARNAANDPDYERQAWYRSAEYRRQTHLATGWTHFLMKQYKLSADDFRSKLDAQGGGCAICGRRDSGEDGRQMHVDHCHKTGVVRGILCAPCNKGLGMFADDPDRLVAAATYLLQYMNALAMSASPTCTVRSAYVDVPDGATGGFHIHGQPAGSGVQDGFATATAPRGQW
jgi:hypothetical protein